MQNADWIALFRRMPEELHCKLVLVMQNRTDISIDTIFRLEPSYVVIRGRLGGTVEGGLLFMVPYDQITNIFVNREIKEDEVNALFGAVPAPAPAVVAATVPLKGTSNQGSMRPPSSPRFRRRRPRPPCGRR